MKDTNYIEKQPYIKVIREIGSVGKTSYKDNRNLYLYKDKLVTAYRTFNLENVFTEYREINSVNVVYNFYKVNKVKGVILFIYTNHGVYSYTVEMSPSSFINTFKRLKKHSLGIIISIFLIQFY